jgi:hypothetical protein
MLLELNKSRDVDENSLASAEGVNKVTFIHEGLLIENVQSVRRFFGYYDYSNFNRRKVISRVLMSKTAPTDAILKEISDRRQKLRIRIDRWKSLQRLFMLSTIDSTSMVPASKSKFDEPEHEVLYLPSSLSDMARVHFPDLATIELKIREGLAFDCIRSIQNVVKILSALHQRRNQDERGQDQRTRSAGKINEVIERRNLEMAAYNASQCAMITLGGPLYLGKFPVMKIADTYRKATHLHRKIGDSRTTEGFVWNGITGGNRVRPLRSLQASSSAMDTEEDIPKVATQGTKAKASELFLCYHLFLFFNIITI